jgi:hypothetical protein
MPLPQGDTEKVSKISLLFTLSFSILLALGALSMAYANFMLGFVLFMLGLILLVGNEFLVFRKLEKKARQEPLPSPAKLLFETINFALVAYIVPSAIALFLFFFQGAGTQVLVIAIAGFTVTSVKVAAKTAQLVIGR